MSEREHDTVWRLVEEDFEVIIEKKYPNLKEHQVKILIDMAKCRFSIDDWYDWAEAFIDTYVDDVKEEK